MYCTGCAKELSDSNTVCESCKNKIEKDAVPSLHSTATADTKTRECSASRSGKDTNMQNETEPKRSGDNGKIARAMRETALLYSMLKYIFIILFALAVLFVPTFKTAHKYTPTSLEEITALNREDAEQLIEKGYIEKGRFSLMNEFGRIISTAKKEDISIVTDEFIVVDDFKASISFYHETKDENGVVNGRNYELSLDELTYKDAGEQNRSIAIVTGIINICTVITAIAIIVLCGVELFKRSREHSAIKRGLDIPAVRPNARKSAAALKMPLILLGLIFADVIYTSIVWANFANSLSADFRRYMIDLNGFTFGLLIVIILLIAAAFSDHLEKELENELGTTKKQ